MTVSIKDIAQAANVSYSTVSRALNESPRVKAETRERIQRTATEMGYLPPAPLPAAWSPAALTS